MPWHLSPSLDPGIFLESLQDLSIWDSKAKHLLCYPFQESVRKSGTFKLIKWRRRDKTKCRETIILPLFGKLKKKIIIDSLWKIQRRHSQRPSWEHLCAQHGVWWRWGQLMGQRQPLKSLLCCTKEFQNCLKGDEASKEWKQEGEWWALWLEIPVWPLCRLVRLGAK